MTNKNICQNPKCCNNDTKDRWNKKIERYQSRKAYFKPHHITKYNYKCSTLEYFCTTSCAYRWLEDNLESIIDHRGTVEKILDKQIRS
jgi:hypothetical protein